ncbi:MAG: hypothetical protein FWD85_11155 [Microbacteriaceae bacterium]|nr:hypothetical protein [Microbacteriaceae bacterium]
MENDPLMKPSDVSAFTGVSVNHLAQLRFRGNGPRCIKLAPKTVRYRRSDVIAWINASERAGTAPVAS